MSLAERKAAEIDAVQKTELQRREWILAGKLRPAKVLEVYAIDE